MFICNCSKVDTSIIVQVLVQVNRLVQLFVQVFGWHKVTCGRKYPGQKSGVGQINKTLKNNKLLICAIYNHWQNITFIFAYKIDVWLKFTQKMNKNIFIKCL
ncbi:hypothetical protein BWP00_02490 [Acinetobacter baumannii]|nr:hypothetical protein BWP00_02490 [Acinetobacter baumannii]